MQIRVPEYYEKFRCLAGACPHSCCEKWEVVIDAESACLYRQVPGALGEKLRAAMMEDEDGDLCFPLNGGRCPFLDRENLCEIHRQLGEQATSVTCREHPRFTEDYGAFREVTLSASCPAANALLLSSEEPLGFIDLEADEPAEEGDPWLEGLLPLRARMLERLTDRSMPLYLRLRQFLLLASEAQQFLDEDEAEMLQTLAEGWQDGGETAAGEILSLSYGLNLLSAMEVLEPDWKDLLRQAETVRPAGRPEALLERIAVYFAFRYLLKCVNDGDLLSRAKLVVLAVLVVERMAAVCGLSEALRRFSCEAEHSEENLERLQEALCYDEKLGISRFLAYLGQ